jgi:hypothetical protein
MTMKKTVFFFFVCATLLQACTDNRATHAEGQKDTKAAQAVPVTKKVFDLEPALTGTDSLQVLFYDDPDGDSLRYSRFFTYTETTDTTQIGALLRELNQVYVQEPRARSCRSEGKLYLLKGEDVLKTVYFSARQDSCRYFYFIRNGNFIYLPLTAAAENWLQARRKVAKKP